MLHITNVCLKIYPFQDSENIRVLNAFTLGLRSIEKHGSVEAYYINAYGDMEGIAFNCMRVYAV